MKESLQPAPAREIKPSGYWQNSEVIEAEAIAAIQEGVNLSHTALKSAQRTSLSDAIFKYYPNGMRGLRENFGLPIRKKPNGFWGKDSGQIEQQAKEALEAGIELTDNKLSEAGMSGLSLAAQRFYPGGLNGLKEKMGIPVEMKPPGFWKDPAN